MAAYMHIAHILHIQVYQSAVASRKINSIRSLECIQINLTAAKQQQQQKETQQQQQHSAARYLLERT